MFQISDELYTPYKGRKFIFAIETFDEESIADCLDFFSLNGKVAKITTGKAGKELIEKIYPQYTDLVIQHEMFDPEGETIEDINPIIRDDIRLSSYAMYILNSNGEGVKLVPHYPQVVLDKFFNKKQ